MNTQDKKKPTGARPSGGMDAVYAIGMVGAWVYFFKQAVDNQERVLAILKGLVWPAFLVYGLFKSLEKE